MPSIDPAPEASMASEWFSAYRTDVNLQVSVPANETRALHLPLDAVERAFVAVSADNSSAPFASVGFLFETAGERWQDGHLSGMAIPTDGASWATRAVSAGQYDALDPPMLHVLLSTTAATEFTIGLVAPEHWGEAYRAAESTADRPRIQEPGSDWPLHGHAETRWSIQDAGYEVDWTSPGVTQVVEGPDLQPLRRDHATMEAALSGEAAFASLEWLYWWPLALTDWQASLAAETVEGAFLSTSTEADVAGGLFGAEVPVRWAEGRLTCQQCTGPALLEVEATGDNTVGADGEVYMEIFSLYTLSGAS